MTVTQPLTDQLSAEVSLEAQWMPFTANRAFRKAPRMLVGAKGMHYVASDGRQVLDGTAGLWCVNAGHCREEIVQAIARQAATLDYAPPFQLGHPTAFALAARLAEMLPGDLKHVFFTNSGSESVDTALKIALAYHRARGEPERVRFVGRMRGYHGVGFGGISVGGIENNRKAFAAQAIPHVDHLPHTHDLSRNAFSRGMPEHGAELADDLERIVAERGAHTIAAVIVEPVAGSTGVLIPPKGYLERLRAICDRHGILLIFDEVITGFGRTGSPFGAQEFGVTPDIITCAKGLTNGAVPMGAVLVSNKIHDAFMQGPPGAIELFHGYTYSAHPIACVAGLATLDIYQREGLLTRAKQMAPAFEKAAHELRGLPHVIDIRNYGLVAGIELEPIAGSPGKRAFDVYLKCFERGLLIRTTGDIIALSPALIIEQAHIDELFGVLSQVLREAA